MKKDDEVWVLIDEQAQISVFASQAAAIGAGVLELMHKTGPNMGTGAVDVSVFGNAVNFSRAGDPKVLVVAEKFKVG